MPTNMVDPVDTPSPAMVTQAPKMATQLQSPSPTMDSPHLQAAAPSTSSGSSDWMVVLLAAGVAIGAAGMATSSSNTSFDTHDWRSWVAAYGLGVWSMMIVWNLAAAVIA